MNIIRLTSLIFILSFVALSGCGGSGGGGDEAPVDLGAAAAVTLTSSKAVILADGTDSATITADVEDADGAAVADGTIVGFSVPSGSGTLSASSAATANGRASVALLRAPIQDALNQTVVVMGTAGSASGIKDVKCINQPASASVSVAFDQAVTNLAGLQFNLNNTATASFNGNVIGENAAAGSQVVGNSNAAANSTTIALINAGGFNAVAAAPVITATFAVTGSGLPSFSVDLTPASFTAISPGGAAISAVTAANMVVTVKFNTE
jgi:hypothetical protein